MNEEIKNQTEEQAAETETSAEPVKETKKEKKQNAKLEEKIAQLEEEAAKQDDRYKRILAEYDNFRKRTQKEKKALTRTLRWPLCVPSCRCWTIWSVAPHRKTPTRASN